MKKTFKCAYCSRQIKTEACPYCGGINELPAFLLQDKPSASNRNDSSDAEPNMLSGKAADCTPPYPPRPAKKPTALNKIITFLKSHTCLRAVVIAFLLVILFVAFMFILWLTTKDIGKPISESSDNTIKIDDDFTITVTGLNKTWDISLPCSLSELVKNISILPPSIDKPSEEDPNMDGIRDLHPFEGETIRDSYGLFYYDIINDSYEVAPYSEAICDTIHTYHFSLENKVSSIKFQGKEILCDMDTLIESFGQPSLMRTYDSYTSIQYSSTAGYIELSYEKSDNYAFPNSIRIDNLRQNRKYY